MPTVSAEQFTRLNLLAGTARSLEQSPVTSEDTSVWERDFRLLCDELSIFADRELGEDLRREKGFYDAALQVAKGYFDKPFGGLKSQTGQFGFRLAGPQDLKQAATALTPAYRSWVQTLQAASTYTYKTYALGYSSGDVVTCSAANTKEVLGFHRLISYKPAPRLMYVEWNVNSFPYPPYNVEPYSKIGKGDKLYKIIPMPGRILLHPGGGFHATFYFDTLTGASAPASTTDVDVEIGIFGLVFGEYDYLKSGTAVLY